MPPPNRRLSSYPPATPFLRGVVSVGTVWALGGLYLDGFAHISNWVESFFTWYHLILYSGVFVPGGLLVLIALGNIRRGYSWRRALPKPYLIALAGGALFFVAGLADLGWHSIFGFEEDVEALLSPTHLVLAAGGFLLFVSPLLEYLQTKPAARPTGWPRLFPVWLSWFGQLALFSFFTQYLNAFAAPQIFVGARPLEDTFIWDTALAAHVIWPTVLLVSFALISLRYWRWPKGFFTAVLTVHALSLWLLYWNEAAHQFGLVILAAPLAGILIDILYARLRPSYKSARARAALRLFFFLMPLIIFLIYFAILVGFYGVWWKIHMWLGVPFVAAIVGWLLALVAAPPETLLDARD
jgi:hypothetical protein